MKKHTLGRWAIAISLATFGLPLVACGGGGDGGDGDGDGDGDVSGDGDGDGDQQYDPALLDDYRRALPGLDILEAPNPGADANMMAAVGDPAEAPEQVAPTARAINEAIRGVVQGLEEITSHPPTVYNSETKEFVWGPWDDEDSALEGDKVLAYIQDVGDEGDFRYHYALARGSGNDLADYHAVIWGGANPDPDNEDYGSGVTLWDLEANRAFLDDFAPDHEQTSQGRFAAAYAKGEDEEGAEVTWVVAAFRDFKGDDAAPEDEAANFDHLYGNVLTLDENNNDLEIDFVNIDATFNIFPEDDASNPENWNIAAVAVNDGAGRAETTVTGGDLETDPDSPGSSFTITECWDGSLARTYKGATVMTEDGEMPAGEEEGTMADCGAHLQNSLADLGIPTLENIDQEMLTALDEVATNGIEE